MDPVLHKISQQRTQTHSDRPEVSGGNSSECAIFSSEQFADQYKTWRRYSLSTNHDICVHCLLSIIFAFQQCNIILDYIQLP